MWKATPLALTFGLSLQAATGLAIAVDDRVPRILGDTGVQGGLVVHVGRGDGTLTAALRVSASFPVQGLDTRVENVMQARRHFQGLGKYGPVSVD